jgi:hypothetical protein
MVPAFVRIAAASALASAAMACGDDDGTGGESQGSNPTDTSPEGPAVTGGVTETSAEESAGTTNATDTSPEGPCPPSECTLTSTGSTSSGATGTDTEPDTGTDTDTDTDASSGSTAAADTTG